MDPCMSQSTWEVEVGTEEELVVKAVDNSFGTMVSCSYLMDIYLQQASLDAAAMLAVVLEAASL